MKFMDAARCSRKHLYILVVLTAILFFLYIYKSDKRILEHVRKRKYAFFDLGANNGDSMVKFFFDRKFDLIKGIFQIINV